MAQLVPTPVVADTESQVRMTMSMVPSLSAQKEVIMNAEVELEAQIPTHICKRDGLCPFREIT